MGVNLCTARKYAHIKQYYEEMEKMHQEGHSYREIEEYVPTAAVGTSFGLSNSTISITTTRPFGGSCTNTVCWQGL